MNSFPLIFLFEKITFLKQNQAIFSKWIGLNSHSIFKWITVKRELFKIRKRKIIPNLMSLYILLWQSYIKELSDRKYWFKFYPSYKRIRNILSFSFYSSISKCWKNIVFGFKLGNLLSCFVFAWFPGSTATPEQQNIHNGVIYLAEHIKHSTEYWDEQKGVSLVHY